MSEIKLQHKILGSNKTQACPFCGMEQECFVSGLTSSFNNRVGTQVEDKWYSFCNCKNIFFTDWSNMNQTAYDKDYSAKYNDIELQQRIKGYAADIIPRMNTSGVFVEIGAANPYVLDYAKEHGFETIGFDINTHSDFIGHKMIIGDAEGETFDQIPSCDVVWCSHMIEHLKKPLVFCDNVNKKLKSGGYFFVAMPDPFFIPWERPALWAHWVVAEHHIMWDMDSFIDECLMLGFELIYANRNMGHKYGNLSGDFQIILRKL